MARRNRRCERQPRRDKTRWEARSNNGVLRQNVANSAKALREQFHQTLEPGVVVFAHVPFEDDPSRYKTRPVVVIAQEGDIVYTHPLTSKNLTARGAVALPNWQSAGLTRPCAAQPRVVALDRLEIGVRIGRLHPSDQHLVNLALPSR